MTKTDPIFHWNVEQGTPEWFKLRSTRLTASHAQAIATAGKGLETYVRSKIQQLIVPDELYTNADIERGNELEDIALAKYGFEREVSYSIVGFVERDKYSGASPDALVEETGGLEVKARNNKIHFGHLLGDPPPSDTMWQIQMNLLVTGRNWWDYISYNPNFEKSLFVYRVEPDIKAFRKLEAGLLKGATLLEEYLSYHPVMDELEALNINL